MTTETTKRRTEPRPRTLAAGLLLAAAAIATGAVFAIGQADAQGPGRHMSREHMSPEQMLERFDSDGDGAVTLEEARAAADARMRERIEAMFETADSDGDGLLSVDEAVTAASGRIPIERIFDMLDADNDGRVTETEIAEAPPFAHRGSWRGGHHGGFFGPDADEGEAQ